MLVIIKDDFVPPTPWPFGRITEVYKDDNDLVRVVTDRMGNNHFKRAANELIYLPINS